MSSRRAIARRFAASRPVLFAGYLIWRLRGSPIPAPSLAKRKILLNLFNKHKARSFLETGTLHGSTAAVFANRAEMVVTIELSPALHAAASVRFAGNPSVECICGDSAHILKEVLASLPAPSLMWLDGHYSGDGTARSDSDTPIGDELPHALAMVSRGCVLAIDDERLFNGTNGYPTEFELMREIALGAPTGTVRLDADIIIVEPVADSGEYPAS